MLGYYAALAGALTLPASAVQVGGIPLADLPLVVAAGSLLLVSLRRHFWFPPGPLLGATLVALAGLWTYVSPPSASFVSSRYEPVAVYQLLVTVGATVRSASNLLSLVKFELALVLVPLVCVLAGRVRPDFLARAALCWVVGLTASCTVAITDGLGLTSISLRLIGYVDVGGRQAGLTPQPNHIGLQAALAAPLLLVAALGEDRRRRRLAVLALGLCLAGLYFSGSRGSAVGVVLALALTVALTPFVRRRGVIVGIVAAFAGALVFLSPFGQQLLVKVRITDGGAAVAASDSDRAALRHQGLLDFLHSPFHGIGWGYAEDAHLIYVQLLAAGGVVGFAGFALYVGKVIAQGAPLRHEVLLAGPLVAVVLSWLIEGTVENLLTDQWLYLPIGLLMLIAVQARDSRGREVRVSRRTVPPPVTRRDDHRARVPVRHSGSMPLATVERPAQHVALTWPEAAVAAAALPSVEPAVGAALDAGARRRTGAIVVDQALYGGTNFLLAVLVAHVSSRLHYGVFGVVLAAMLIGAGLSRGATGEMLVLRFREHGSVAWSLVAGVLARRALVLGVGFGGLVEAAALVALPADFGRITVAFAIAAPVVFCQDTARYAAFACGRPWAALVSDTTFAVVQIAVTSALVLTGTASATALILAWGAGAAAGAIAGLSALRVRRLPRHQAGTAWPWSDALGLRLGLDNALTQVTQQGSTFLIAGLGAVSGVAGLRVAQTLFGPAIVLALGFQAAYTRELVRRRQSSLELMRASARRAGVMLGLVILASMLVALAIPNRLGSDVFGASWQGVRILIVLFGVGGVAGGAAVGAVAGLRALEDATSTLRVRVSSLVLTLALVAIGELAFGVRGAVGGLSLASAGSAVYWWAQFERSWRRQRALSQHTVA